MSLHVPREKAPAAFEWRVPQSKNSAPAGESDWAEWTRRIERKRKLLPASVIIAPPEFFPHATFVSFRMDGLEVTEQETVAALARGAAGRQFRSRQSQRLRNHVAILKDIERSLKRGRAIHVSDVIRWYTSISCGLSTSTLSDAAVLRLTELVRRAGSPQFRLRPAVQEIAHLHAQAMSDPVVPSFNGILARLLLRYHLGRCSLPPVILDPIADAPRITDESRLLPRLMELIDSNLPANG